MKIFIHFITRETIVEIVRVVYVRPSPRLLHECIDIHIKGGPMIGKPIHTIYNNEIISYNSTFLYPCTVNIANLHLL